MKNDPTPKSNFHAHPLTSLAAHLHALKRLPRTGWRERGLSEVESVAGHSFGVVVWTLWLGERANLHQPGTVDVGRALKLAALHDLPEAQIGDLTPTQKRLLFGDEVNAQKHAVQEAERRFWKRWDEPSSSPLAADTSLLWRRWREDFEDMRAQETREAKLVKQADALECVWQALCYKALAGDLLEEFRGLLLPASGGDPEFLAWLTELWDAG